MPSRRSCKAARSQSSRHAAPGILAGPIQALSKATVVVAWVALISGHGVNRAWSESWGVILGHLRVGPSAAWLPNVDTITHGLDELAGGKPAVKENGRSCSVIISSRVVRCSWETHRVQHTFGCAVYRRRRVEST